MEQFVVLPVVNKRSKVGFDNYLINLDNINYIREWADEDSPGSDGKCCVYFNGSDKKYLIIDIGREALLEFLKRRSKSGSN